LLGSLAAHYGFNVETPFADLPERIQQIVCMLGRETIPFDYSTSAQNQQQEHASRHVNQF